MAWLAQSLADSLRLDEDDGDEEEEEDDEEEEDRGEQQNENIVFATETRTNNYNANPKQQLNGIENEEELTEIPLTSTSTTTEELQSRGVKEDLTELKQTLTRQFWGVANFLAPPPPPPPPPHPPSDPSKPSRSDLDEVSECDPPEEVILAGPGSERIGSDRGEGGGEEEEEEEEFDPVGVTEEVLAFARNIAMHPETWLDFPLDPEDDLDDFKMTTAQQEHAMAIEHLAPRLRALRIELCPCHMSESYFWKVYFVLLHSRLEKHDAEILSTPQVMEARAMWMDELQKQTKAEADWSGLNSYHMKESVDMLHEDPFVCSPSYVHLGSRSTPFRTFGFEPERSSVALDDEIEKHPIATHETEIIDKAVIQEDAGVEYKDKSIVGMSSKLHVQNFEDDDYDDWPEDDIDLAGYKAPAISIGLEEDISFSDLEDDDDVCMPIRSKTAKDGPERGSS